MTQSQDPSARTRTAKPLSARRRRFVEEYLVDLNGQAAAVRAGYKEKHARGTASELLARADVQEALAAAQEARAERTAVTADRVVRELAALAFADLRQVVTWNRAVRVATPEDGSLPVESVWSVELKEPAELSDAAAATLAEVSLTPAGTLKVKMHSKTKALELLARHLGMFEALGGAGGGDDPVKVTPDNVAELSARARARLRVVNGT